MAGAKPAVHVVQLKPICVSETLLKGSKFIKWDDDSSVGVPVTLKVDPKGYILYWRDQVKDMDSIDISMIRDTRTGKYAKVPKEGKLRDSCTMGAPDVPIEDKTVSVCYSSDFVNIQWVNFVCNTKETAKGWTDELCCYAYNLLSQNGSVMYYLQKIHTKLSYITGTDGKIPVKNIIKAFASHKDDKKRVEQTLSAVGLPSGKGESIQPEKFTFETFFHFYRQLTVRSDLDSVFEEIGAKKKPYITVEKLVQFLNEQQRDPRLNEILYPYYDQKRAQAIIDQFENNESLAKKGHLSLEGFLKYLISDENVPIPADKYDLSEEMTHPLPHYFINSSHNTYLTGHQLTGKSSVEIYRQCLLSGCRCIELDCWDGKGADEEPIITHGFTMCTEISFKEVIEAIKESSFKTSDYPVILSFENHCTPRQQAKMANYCKDILGDLLLTDTIADYPLEPGKPLPSPEALKRKILIKNKKRHNHKKPVAVKEVTTPTTAPVKPVLEHKESQQNVLEGALGEGGGDKEKSDKPATENGEVKDYSSDSDTESDDDDIAGLTEEEEKRRQREKKEKGTAGSEAEAAQEMSALVNYIQPIHFHSFEISEKRDRSFEMSSLVESIAMSRLKEYPVEFVNYNKRQLSRIYPKGTRVDSSNYMPQVFWNAGCQMVALNFQMLDLAMQLNLGVFEYNGKSGYILKPDFMRRNDRHFDPFAESTVDGIIAGAMSIRIISGSFLSDKRVGTYVEVEMYGLPADTVRKKRTKTVPSNGINPMYDNDPFVFKKIVLPNLAVLRIAVYEESGKSIGQRILPVEGLRPGYRHIMLRNESNKPLSFPSLFVHIQVKDFVPDDKAELMNALMDPIRYQSEMEKHAAQLAALTDDFDVDEETERENAEMKREIKEDVKFRRNNSQMTKNDSGSDLKTLNGSSATNRSVKGVHPNLGKQQSTVSQASSQSTGSATIPGSVSSGSIRPNQENGGPSEPASNKSKLNDAEVLTPTPLSELREHKVCLKIITKQEKEQETMRKKHEKVRNAQKESQECEEEKLLLSQIRLRTGLEKTQAKAMKKAIKAGNMEEVKRQQEEEINNLVADHDQKHNALKKAHIEVLKALYKDHFKQEMEVAIKYNNMKCDTLEKLIDENHEAQLEQLDAIHDREVVELKKRFDAQSKQDMKALAKKHKDKQELQRVKREAQHKHINMVVQERERLRALLEKRKNDVIEKQAEIKKQFETEKSNTEEEIETEFEEKCDKLDNSFNEQLEALENGDIPKGSINDEDANTNM
ncbi:unnamed protein product [Owenia fusiformis]|uniref:1-phosphatidylinositol 4,5-bisphosphate phosphodiesterase n=1 Tax=Owenia fusiformis TaxID=6347 RepID=A0A8S4PHE8_OWEFU|nr:unnamed protein product [Owenia fusiformis]